MLFYFPVLILCDIKIEEFSESDKVFLKKFKQLKSLSLPGVGLKSLKNFPKLPSLKILDVRGNHNINWEAESVKEEVYRQCPNL
jgi:hypothetical protein